MNTPKQLSEPVCRILDVCKDLREQFPQHEEAILNIEYYTSGYLGDIKDAVTNKNETEAIKETREIAHGFSYHELTDYLNKKLYQRQMPSNTMVVQSNGIDFNVRLVQKGDTYGKDNCLTHEKNEPLVEFYDSRYKQGFGEHGQFVSRYYLSTLTEPGRTGGLQLEGGIPEWSISNEGMQQVKDWLKSFNSPYYGLPKQTLSKEKGLSL